MSVVDGTAALTPEPIEGEAAQEVEAACLKKSHDEEFRLFTEQSYHTVERILRAWCWDREAVQDALQSAYLQGRIQWPKIRTYTEPIAWTITTARNKILKEHDRRQREAATPPEHLPAGPQSDLADAWEAQEMLRSWLQQLPPRQAEVFQMAREGFSNNEIARILGLADISVRRYKAAAKQRLRQLAEETGYTDSDSRRQQQGGAHGPR
jgi:RNA polymerase sigma factor (sigma-70 family)